ncbi:hypothetical protein EMPG_12634 [Blastomyces silverae]|uniref:Uncharacterized protein n=1 Tax=Blastomyces silverae TaxID=2060906 RepID=A0A0H1BT71_9EURO|nr:hypothetical protein EMPG_12634 [Blastomyces silverae]
MSFTEMYMTGHTTECGSLPSIGSSAQNAGHEEGDADFVNLLQEPKEAETVRSTFGEGAYQNYIEMLRSARVAMASKEAKLAAKKASLKNSTIRKWLLKLKLAYTG